MAKGTRGGKYGSKTTQAKQQNGELNLTQAKSEAMEFLQSRGFVTSNGNILPNPVTTGTEFTSTGKKTYDSIYESIKNGEPITKNYSVGTLQQVRDRAEMNLVGNARNLFIGMLHRDDAEYYSREKNTLNKIISYCDAKSNNKLIKRQATVDKYEKRDVTSNTYEKAQKRLYKQVESWFGKR